MIDSTRNFEMTESNLESIKTFLATMRVELLRQAVELNCVHPFRLMAIDAHEQVRWLELNDGERLPVMDMSGPESELTKFPVILELKDAKGKKLIMLIHAPRREYLH